MNRVWRIALAAAFLLIPTAFGQWAATGTTQLQVTVGPEAALLINTATTALTTPGTVFTDYTGTTSFSYKIRTNSGTHGGNITLEVTTDFAPAGGPSVGTPPSAGDTLTYTCTVAAPGTGCSGTVTASTTAATSVATFGASAHSAKAGNAGSTAWDLTNDPTYVVGTYNATVTYTISLT